MKTNNQYDGSLLAYNLSSILKLLELMPVSTYLVKRLSSIDIHVIQSGCIQKWINFTTVWHMLTLYSFYQHVSIASYASAGIARAEMSVRLSVTLWYCIKMKKASVMISSPCESLNILVSRNIWFITKFDRGHPARGRFLRLGWVRTGDFGDFSTNKPPYLRNGAR